MVLDSTRVKKVILNFSKVALYLSSKDKNDLSKHPVYKWQWPLIVMCRLWCHSYGNFQRWRVLSQKDVLKLTS